MDRGVAIGNRAAEAGRRIFAAEPVEATDIGLRAVASNHRAAAVASRRPRREPARGARVTRALFFGATRSRLWRGLWTKGGDPHSRGASSTQPRGARKRAPPPRRAGQENAPDRCRSGSGIRMCFSLRRSCAVAPIAASACRLGARTGTRRGRCTWRSYRRAGRSVKGSPPPPRPHPTVLRRKSPCRKCPCH